MRWYLAGVAMIALALTAVNPVEAGGRGGSRHSGSQGSFHSGSTSTFGKSTNHSPSKFGNMTNVPSCGPDGTPVRR